MQITQHPSTIHKKEEEGKRRRATVMLHLAADEVCLRNIFNYICCVSFRFVRYLQLDEGYFVPWCIFFCKGWTQNTIRHHCSLRCQPVDQIEKKERKREKATTGLSAPALCFSRLSCGGRILYKIDRRAKYYCLFVLGYTQPKNLPNIFFLFLWRS